MWKNLKNDILPGITFLIFSVLFVFLTPGQVKTTESGFFTARTFPYLTLGIIAFCCILLIGMGLMRTVGSRRMERNEKNAEEKGRTEGKADERINEKINENKESLGNTGMMLKVFLLVAIAVVIGGMVGFLVSGIFLTIGFLLMYRDRNIIHYVIVVVLVVAFYYLFKLGFGLKLP